MDKRTYEKRSKDCLICERIVLIKKNKNPYFIKEFETGYAVLGDTQFFTGYCLFLCKYHKNELHELKPEIRKKFLVEMSVVAEAVYRAFRPVRLNYELLGNSHHHLHWHIFPRYEDDPLPKNPVWCIDPQIINAKGHQPNTEELNSLKQKILDKIPVL
jgi:diadenosine tetraphosphate (Ap4A) HIT family hydrolase